MSAIYDDFDPKYAAMCSEATLQSNVTGFFKSFVDHVTDFAERNEWLSEVLGGENGDREKLFALLENKELMETINETLSYIQPVYREKSASISKEKRQEAMAALRNGDIHMALALSSQAVIRAPMPGENELIDGGLSLALGLWIRSEILMKMDLYELALQDLKLALKERLPAKERGDYYWRMGNCYRGAGETTKAKVSYDLALRLLSANSDAKARLEKDIEALKDLNPRTATVNTKTEIPLTAGAKMSMPALSKLVKITEEKDKGRFAIASEHINTGDVLLTESPYAACLLPEYFGSHCNHCFQRLVSPIWCQKCAGIAFCSADCRDVAVATYHKYECSFSDLFLGSGMSILSHIAFRMVTQVGLDTSLNIHSKYIANECKIIETSSLNDIEGQVKTSKFKSRKEKLSKGKRSKNMKKLSEPADKIEEIKQEDGVELKASQIYSLCTHSELRNPKDFLQRILMSLFLVNCLKKTAFFKGVDGGNIDKEVQSILELILRNLQLLQFNAHELYETVRSPTHKFNGAKATYVAVGIYPTAALFNHECYPAVGRYFDGTKIVMRAIRPLRPGEPIAENYGPQFIVRQKAERQRALGCRYWFMCMCKACEQDWPTLKQMTNGSEPYVKCGNNSCVRGVKCQRNGDNRSWSRNCPHCGHVLTSSEMTFKWNTVQECIRMYQAAAEYMQSEKVDEAIRTLCLSIDQFHEVSSPPHKETHLAQEALRSCFADSGNIHIVTGSKNDSQKTTL